MKTRIHQNAHLARVEAELTSVRQRNVQKARTCVRGGWTAQRSQERTRLPANRLSARSNLHALAVKYDTRA